MADTKTTIEIKDDISHIEKKRVILEQIVCITNAIEEMQDSLNSVLILGLPSTELPKEALALYDSLSGNMQNQPANKIKDYLQSLEIIINSQLEKILQLSGMDFDSDETVEILFISSDDSEESLLDLLSDFKRTSQTAVSLRVLLKKRGISTSGAVLAVPQEVINRQLKHLEEEEKQQREQMKAQVVEMQNDLERMIDNPNYPEAMKAMLIETKENLQNDLVNIDKGKKLELLSFVSGTQELTDLDYEEVEIKAPDDSNGQNAPKNKSNLYELTHSWLNSSWDVSWQDVKKDNK